MDKLDIYVVEGPAGSGKSTIIEFQGKKSDSLILDTHYRGGTRDYRGAVGLIDISVRDMQRVAYALTANIEVVIMDRWILGSMVYDSIRNEAPFPDLDHFSHTMLGWMSIIMGFQHVLAGRQRIPLRKIQIHWMLNIPSAEDISRRRLNTGKKYPFEVFKELECYRLIRYRLEQWLEDYGLMGMLQHEVQDIVDGDWQWNSL